MFPCEMETSDSSLKAVLGQRPSRFSCERSSFVEPFGGISVSNSSTIFRTLIYNYLVAGSLPPSPVTHKGTPRLYVCKCCSA